MPLINASTAGQAGKMSEGGMYTYSYATASNDYTVVCTHLLYTRPSFQTYMTAVGNDILFKMEYSTNTITWNTLVEDYPVAAGTSAAVTFILNTLYYRVSVKPKTPNAFGGGMVQINATEKVLPVENRWAYAHESLTVTNTVAVGCTQALIAPGALSAIITVEDNPVRVLWTGAIPTATDGHLLQAGDSLTLDFTADIFHFRVIATGNAAKVKITYAR